MAIYQLGEWQPDIAESAWVAGSAEVIGRVTLEADVNIWFGSILRGDTEFLHLGAGTNVQDGSVLHADKGFPLQVGPRVSIGHHVTLHGCSVGEGTLIGMGAVVLNGAKIGKHCLVGAGALVTEGKEIPDGSLVVGSPARVIRPLSAEQIQGLEANAAHYIENARLYAAQMKKIA